MRKQLLLTIAVALLVGSCECQRDNLVISMNKKCGDLCFSKDLKYRDVGLCRAGTWACDEEGNILNCEGEVLPAWDVCDGLDNDCDGEIDEGHRFTECVSQCGLGYNDCSNGQIVCHPVRTPVDEICNGADDDCDGKIDEPEDMPVEFCYTGNNTTLLNGECRPGVIRCNVLGYRECVGQVLPTAETCNNKDDNCDGIIDNVDGGIKKLVESIVCLDNSGSMSRYTAQVNAGLTTFHQNSDAGSLLREGLVTAPDSDAVTYGKNVRLAQDLTDAGVFMAAVRAQNGYSGSIEEPTLDALVKICKNDLNISWTPSSKKSIILFTDEDPQSYETPENTIYDAITACANANIAIYCFVDSPTTIWGARWVSLCTAPGNRMYNINGNIAKDLEDVMRSVTCF